MSTRPHWGQSASPLPSQIKVRRTRTKKKNGVGVPSRDAKNRKCGGPKQNSWETENNSVGNACYFLFGSRPCLFKYALTVIRRQLNERPGEQKPAAIRAARIPCVLVNMIIIRTVRTVKKRSGAGLPGLIITRRSGSISRRGSSGSSRGTRPTSCNS